MTQKEFINNFLSTFAKNISEEELKKYGISKKRKKFLWNIFAAKLVDCYEGNEARIEYDKAEKNGALEIQYDDGFMGLSDIETKSLSGLHLSSKAIDNIGLPEFYVIGKDFSWCYVITHEFDLCGPYFCYKPN